MPWPIFWAAQNLYSNSVADGEEYSGQMIMNLERARIRASHNSTSSSKLLGVVGIDFPIFGDFGKDAFVNFY